MREIKGKFEKKIFHFKIPAGTSRGILKEKKAWFITLWDEENPTILGVGECSVIPKLSPDYVDDLSYEAKVKEVIEDLEYYLTDLNRLRHFPSIYFGLEMALIDLKNGGKRIFFDTPFTRGEVGIPINGLIWMGTPEFMQEQITEKLKQGFTCVKMKIGAIDFEKEIEILRSIREKAVPDKITLRVDANGAFSVHEVVSKLKRLKEFQLHSIEQPIRPKLPKKMRELTDVNIIPIALDEELIGVYEFEDKKQLLLDIRPQYIILKPSLVGGFKGAMEWIEAAETFSIPWWITSALESNIGLDAIAQFTSNYDVILPQGLGTGSLYTNNIESTLVVERGMLKHVR